MKLNELAVFLRVPGPKIGDPGPIRGSSPSSNATARRAARAANLDNEGRWNEKAVCTSRTTTRNYGRGARPGGARPSLLGSLVPGMPRRLVEINQCVCTRRLLVASDVGPLARRAARPHINRTPG